VIETVLAQDFNRTKAALMQEHKQKKEQLTSAHEARMDAMLISDRQSSLKNFMQELNAEAPDVSITRLCVVMVPVLTAEYRPAQVFLNAFVCCVFYPHKGD